MNKNIQKYKQIQNQSLTGKDLNIKVFSSLKGWITDTYNRNLIFTQRMNALNNCISLATTLLQNLNNDIPIEEREKITMILNLIIKKCSDTVTILDKINEKHFKNEIDSLDIVIELIKK
jgi:hypothetical protein